MKSGFSVVEALVGIAASSITILAIAYAFNAQISANRRIQNRVQAETELDIFVKNLVIAVERRRAQGPSIEETISEAFVSNPLESCEHQCHDLRILQTNRCGASEKVRELRYVTRIEKQRRTILVESTPDFPTGPVLTAIMPLSSDSIQSTACFRICDGKLLVDAENQYPMGNGRKGIARRSAIIGLQDRSPDMEFLSPICP